MIPHAVAHSLLNKMCTLWIICTIAVVQVFGAGYVNRTGLLLCCFGDTALVEAIYASPSVVRCSAPARGVPGAVNVAVSIDGGSCFGHSVPATVGYFRYFEPSMVIGISPRSGPETGGTVITVLGSGFSDDFPFMCSFSGATTPTNGIDSKEVVIPASFLSTSRMTCIAPPASSADDLAIEKEVAIFVDFGDGVWTPIPNAPGDSTVTPTFTYVPSIQLTALNPDHGPTTGGTVVEISGTNFHPFAQAAAASSSISGTVWCRFGSVATVGHRVSNWLIRCSSPARAINAPTNVEVTISVNDGGDFTRGSMGAELVRGERGKACAT